MKIEACLLDSLLRRIVAEQVRCIFGNPGLRLVAHFLLEIGQNAFAKKRAQVALGIPLGRTHAKIVQEKGDVFDVAHNVPLFQTFARGRIAKRNVDAFYE